MFELDERLRKDGPCLEGLCENHLVIHRQGTQFPWLILVPKVAGAREIFDLEDAARDDLFRQAARLSAALAKVTDAFKINVEAIGNVCAQLHLHIIARRKDDPAWPAPVWTVPLRAEPGHDSETLGRQLAAAMAEG